MKKFIATLLCTLMCGCSTLQSFNQKPIKEINSGKGKVNVVLSTPYAMTYELGYALGLFKTPKKIKFSAE